METLEERIAAAKAALEQAKQGGDATEIAKSEARVATLEEAKEFHASELNRVSKKIRSEGGEVKAKQIAEDLGVSIEEAKQIIADRKAEQERNQTETEAERKKREKAEAERDALRAEREEAYALLAETTLKGALKDALRGAGIIPQYLNHAVEGLANLDNLEIGENREVTGVDEEVERIKKDVPVFFGDNAEPPAGSPPSPQGVRRNGQQETEAAKKARERMRRNPGSRI